MRHSRRRPQAAFTLIEAMVVVALVVILLVLAAPSFRELIEMQRLRSTNSQLVTDMQFARTEAVSRQRSVVLRLGATGQADARSCYTLYTCTAANFNCDCDCLRGPGNACTANAAWQEIRTVVIPASSGVHVGQAPAPMNATEVRFDPRTGGVQAVAVPRDRGPPVVVWTGAVDTRLVRDAEVTLRTWVSLSGRPSVCAPSRAVSGFSSTCATN